MKTTHYTHRTQWDSKDDFISWTKSESFKKAHRNVGKNKLFTVVAQCLRDLRLSCNNLLSDISNLE